MKSQTQNNHTQDYFKLMDTIKACYNLYQDKLQEDCEDSTINDTCALQFKNQDLMSRTHGIAKNNENICAHSLDISRSGFGLYQNSQYSQSKQDTKNCLVKMPIKEVGENSESKFMAEMKNITLAELTQYDKADDLDKESDHSRTKSDSDCKPDCEPTFEYHTKDCQKFA